MPTMNVSRRVDIDAPLNTVIPLLLRFEHWPTWSPWLCQEPEAEVKYTGPQGEIGSGYSWNGQRVGAGSMNLKSASESRIDCDLNFLKPFKSHASVSFDLERLSDSSCRVQWSMQSSLPFFMFFMRKAFETYIGADYRRGLAMLKELAETGSVASHVDIQGLHELPACQFIALEGAGSIEDLGEIMSQHFLALESALAEHKLTAVGPPYCHYQVMDPVKDRWRFLTSVPISDKKEVPGFVQGTRPALKRCAQVRHTGHYHHMGNGWATVFGWMRADKLRHNKKLGGFEIYLDNPRETASKNLRTDIYVPLK